MKNELKMYLSFDMKNILNQMENPIAKDILNLNENNNKFDISFIDIHNDENDVGKITFLNSYKYNEEVKKIEKDNLDIIINDNTSIFWNTKNRSQPTKIGKIVKKLFKNKYNEISIENFTNEFKFKTKKNNRMKVVYGDEILKWYLEENYANNTGVLGNSCMKYKEKSSFMELYAENDKNNDSFSHIGMLILTDDNNKLLGRSIVWFNSILPFKERIFMDRIYTIDDSDILLFKDYAKKRNWLYKRKQSYNDSCFIDPSTNKSYNEVLSFRIKSKKFNKYPYLDTLRFYTPKTGRISSISNNNKKFKEYYLQRQDGGVYNSSSMYHFI